MATRLYFSNLSTTYYPPTVRGDWTAAAAGSFIANGRLYTKGGTATTFSRTITSSTEKGLLGRWVSLPLANNWSQGIAYPITFSYCIGTLAASGTSAVTAFYIYATVGDTDVVRCELAATKDTKDTVAWTTVGTGHGATGKGLTVGGPLAGDRIVVEVGYINSAGTGSASLHFGNTGSTDLTTGSTNVTTEPGWIEFKNTDVSFNTSGSPASTFVEGFNVSPVTAEGKWFSSAPPTITNGTAVFTAGTAIYNTSTQYRNVDGDAFYAEILSLPTAGYAYFQLFFGNGFGTTVSSSTSGMFQWSAAGPTINPYITVNGTSVSGTSFASSAATRFWRFSVGHTAPPAEQTFTLYLETAPAASGPWTTRHSANISGSSYNHTDVSLSAAPGSVGNFTIGGVNAPWPIDTAALSGTGTLTTSAVPKPTGVAGLSGSGTLSTVGVPKLTGAAALSASGTLGATGNPGSSASLFGAGSLDAVGISNITGAAALSASGTLSALASDILIAGSASLTGSGTLTATGFPLYHGVADYEGTGTLTGIGVARYIDATNLSGTGTLAGNGVARYYGTANFSGTGNLRAFDDDPFDTNPDAFGSQGVGVELRIYDKLDPSILVDTVPQRIEPQYLEELKGPGGGSFKIKRSDPRLVDSPDLLDYRNVVQVRLFGKVIGSWLISKKAETLIGEGEFADQAYDVSGPGLREWFKDAVVYPEAGSLGAVGGARSFSFASTRGSWYHALDWKIPVNMNRQDAGRLLAGITVADAVQPGLAENAPATSPDGKPQRVNGFKLPGYQLYGTDADPSAWFWDGAVTAGSPDLDYADGNNGWHLVVQQSEISIAPATNQYGGVRYPYVVGPGIVVYGYINPITGAWTDIVPDDIVGGTTYSLIKHSYWERGTNFSQISVERTGTSPGTREATDVMSTAEPEPTSWIDANPWKYYPQDWPDAPHARWIWDRDSRFATSGIRAPAGNVYFRREFTTTTDGNFSLFIAADNQFTAYLDGQIVGTSETQDSSTRTTRVDMPIKAGSHILAFKATNWEEGLAGLLVALFRAGNADIPSAANAVLVSGDDGWVCQGYPASTPGWSAGEVLRVLFAEAAARGVQSIARMALSFSDTLDSNGVPWGTPIDWSFDLGSDYADVVTKIEELLADINIRTTQSGEFIIEAFITRGNDKADNNADIVVLRPGLNVTGASEEGESSVKNQLLLSSADGWLEETDEHGSVSEYGRIEGFVNVTGPATMAQLVAAATFSKLSMPLISTSVAFVSTEDNQPWKDFYVGDWILGPTHGKQLERRRVMSLAMSEVQETGRILFAAEFDTISKDRTEKIERWLKSTADGTLGGQVANASGGGAGSAPLNVSSGPQSTITYSNKDLIGQIISGANIIDGTLVAADKMVAHTITGELIQADAITATMIRSGTLTSDVIIGGYIRTAAPGDPAYPSRAEMNSTGFHTFNSDGDEVFRADNAGNIFISGTFATGFAPESRVELLDTTAVLGFSLARMALWSGFTTETEPMFVANYIDGTVWPGSIGQLSSSNDGFGIIQMAVLAPTATSGGGWLLTNSGSALQSQLDLEPDVNVRVFNGTAVQASVPFASLSTAGQALYPGGLVASLDHGLQVGATNGTHLAVDNCSLQALDNTSLTAPLFLQWDGGNVSIQGNPNVAVNDIDSLANVDHPLTLGYATGSNMAFSATTIQSRYAGAAATLYLNYYGGSLHSPGMRAVTSILNAIPSTTSTTFVVVGLAVTLICPASGIIQVQLDGAPFNSVATNRTEIGFRVRQNNSAGTILYDGTGTIDTTSRAGALATYSNVSMTRLVSGLTSGITLYVEVLFRSSAAGTANIQVPSIVVTPIM